VRRPRFLDYYRQFAALSPEEDARRLKARRDEEKARALAITPVLDLSRSEWHEPPDPEVINAATYAMRRAINRYPEPGGGAAREAIAARHGVDEQQVAVGHGAAQLMQAALRESAYGQEVVLAWPSWGPLPALIGRAGAAPVPVELDPAGVLDLVGMAAAVGERTRAVVLCSPNDPTGALLDPDDLRQFATSLPANVLVLLDEALVDFLGEVASSIGLVAGVANLLVFRSFSKAWAMAGYRAGYAVGGPEQVELLARMTPGLGVTTPTLAAIAAALDPTKRGRQRMERRRETVVAERDRLLRVLRGSPFTIAPSRSCYVWLSGEGMEGAAIARGLSEARIIVAPGADWGDDEHVRITLRDKPATERLGSALLALA
jgi:histidinol-phosphate/aromatic aminotransferase/cobyric acid decarboxylase-like protein